MNPSRILIMIAMACSTAVYAETDIESEQIVSQALAALDSEYKSSWAYTRSSKKADKPEYIGRFDPSQPAAGKWTLISVGDRAATTKEQEEWVAKRTKNDEENKNGIGKTFIPGSVRLLEESATHWLFAFNPAPDDDDDKKERKVISHIAGELRVSKAGLNVEEIFLSNEEPIRPATGIKIKLFKIRMTYGSVFDGGPLVPLSVSSHVKGRAFLAIAIDEVKNVHFSDYQKVVPSSGN